MHAKDELILKLRNAAQDGFRTRLEADLRLWRANYDIMEKLIEVGLVRADVDIENATRNGYFVKIEQSDLPKLRRVFDTVKDSGMYEVEDASKNLVRVILDVGQPYDKYWGIKVYYVRELASDSRCRIERRSLDDSTVVCAR